MVSSLQKILDRDLNKLKEEIKAYTNEKDLWKIDGTIKNSAGNLALHLCGNLQHFIGHVLGNTNYKRNREAEFSGKKEPREAIVKDIDATIDAVNMTLNELDQNAISKRYPIDVLGFEMTTVFFLIHLATHLNYHLGQINYHRRILVS